MNRSTEFELASCIEETITPLSFKRVDPVPTVETVEMLAVWKRKTFNMNRGVALVVLPSSDIHPGEFARAARKPVGKKIGYIPFVYELGLQLVLIGRGVLASATNVHRFVDTINTFTVLLQSIHVVDMDITNLVGCLPAEKKTFEESTELPRWARGIELLSAIKRLSTDFVFERGKTRCQFSEKTRKASISVRTWGQKKTGPFIDAIEDGIDRFINL